MFYLLLLLVHGLALVSGVTPTDWVKGHFLPGVEVLQVIRGGICAWSPDGERLAYVEGGRLYMLQGPRFSQRSCLLSELGSRCSVVRGMSWSPDGERLLLEGERIATQGRGLWVVKRKDPRLKELELPSRGAEPGRLGLWLQGWLNRREIAFIQYSREDGYLLLGKIDTESGSSWRLSRCAERLCWQPGKDRSLLVRLAAGRQAGVDYLIDGWVPGSNRLLYTRRIRRGRSTRRVCLYSLDLLSGQGEELQENAGWAACSPQGDFIAFLLWGRPRYDHIKRLITTDYAEGKPFRLQVAIMRMADKTLCLLIPLGSKPVTQGEIDDWELFRPRWSPDGRWLLLRNTAGGLFIISREGRGYKGINRDLLLQGSWSPKGDKLALYPAKGEAAGQEGSIYIVKVSAD